MLPTGEVVKDVYLDNSSGVIAGVEAAATETPVRKLLVECGTIESAMILEVGQAVDKARPGLPEGSVIGKCFHDRGDSGAMATSDRGKLTIDRLHRRPRLRRP